MTLRSISQTGHARPKFIVYWEGGTNPEEPVGQIKRISQVYSVLLKHLSYKNVTMLKFA